MGVGAVRVGALDKLGGIFASSYTNVQGRKLCNFLFQFLRTDSLLKRVYSKRKEFAPFGSKFFPFRVDPFKKGGKNNLTFYDEAIYNDILIVFLHAIIFVILF